MIASVFGIVEEYKSTERGGTMDTILLYRILLFVILTVLFVVPVGLFVAEYLIVKAVLDKRYGRAARIIAFIPSGLQGGTTQLWLAGNHMAGVYLALASGDMAFAAQLTKRILAKDGHNMAPMIAQLYMHMKQGAWGDAEQSLMAMRRVLPDATAPAEILAVRGQAERVIAAQDASADLSFLLDVDGNVAKLYRGNPKRFARDQIVLAIFLVLLLIGGIVVGPYLNQL